MNSKLTHLIKRCALIRIIIQVIYINDVDLNDALFPLKDVTTLTKAFVT